MSKPETRDDLSKKRKNELKRNFSLMGRKRVASFEIYFLILIGLSIILIVYYWPHTTFEDRIDSLNSTISSDNAQLKNIDNMLKDASKNNTTNPEKQDLLDRQTQLRNEITNDQKTLDDSKMKLEGGDTLEKTDWFLFGTVKNFVMVLLGGTLGGSVATFRSFYSFKGNRNLRISWTSMYIFRPWEGTAAGLITYILVRSGIYAGLPGSASQAPVLFVIEAGAIISGLYSAEIFDKFHDVFNTLFNIKDSKTDPLAVIQKYPPTVRNIIDNSMIPSDEILVALYPKVDASVISSLAIDPKYSSVFAQDKSYWMVDLSADEEGVYWIKDEDQKVVCHYIK